MSRRSASWQLALRYFLLAALCLGALACGRHGGLPPQAPLNELRKSGPNTSDPKLAGRWLLSELISPGGDAKQARAARKHLDELGGGGVLANVARGLDDSMHGKLETAPDHYLTALKEARTSEEPNAALIAWFASSQATGLRDNAPDLWKRWRPFVEAAIKEPLNIGWRARADLVDWWASEAYDQAQRDLPKLEAKAYGCIRSVRIAGPFGRGAAADVLRTYGAEKPGPWPLRWDREPTMGEDPRVLKTSQEGCQVSADESVEDGVFYAETFIELPEAREAVIAVQGALEVWVNDQSVLKRDPREWGVWPRFGFRAWLGKGRHRLLAKLTDAGTAIRVLTPDGRPLEAKNSDDPAPGYSIIPPRLMEDPNVLSRYIQRGNVIDPKDDFLRLAAADLAHTEGQGDVASVLFEPLIKDMKKATGPALVLAALYADSDPVFEQSQVKDLVRELHQRALVRDPGLWVPALSLALNEAEQKGATEAVRKVKALVDRFPQVPAVLSALSRIYSELGWSVEYKAAVKLLEQRFPKDTGVLLAAIDVYEEEGNVAKADALVKRVRALSPDSELQFSRALGRRDFAAALAELKRLGARRPERKDIAERVYDVMVRAGNTQETWKKLEAQIKQSPRDGSARLALADARFASGKLGALRRALVDAFVDGAGTEPLESAIDLVETATVLEPYRLDGLKVIKAYEKQNRHMQGTAARVLDYAAVWVHADGSSRMLEHEIIRIQSAEAVGKLAEQRRLAGQVLQMRVVKKDGRILEPELVAEKPSVTFPHLEVGDYIETEHITSHAGDGSGEQYLGPHWFFREENIAYARSEFVVIAPSSKQLIIETHNNVPKPKLDKSGALAVYRWRVDDSPAAPTEPNSAPLTEFLPSVRIGWGITEAARLRAIADSVVDLNPVDPRVRRIASKIVEPLKPKQKTERAQRLYRWVLANVEEGEESDGRRVIIGKSGNRWRGFMTLCRALGIGVDYAIAKNRLAAPPVGPIAAATQFTEPLLRLDGQSKPTYLTVSNKYAPFGYVPASARGEDAYLLVGDKPQKFKVPAGGTQDSIVYQGSFKLAADGSARGELDQRFYGKYAMALRGALAQLPEQRLADLIESRILGSALRGARLVSHRIDNVDNLDAPLILHMVTEVPTLAQASGGILLVAPPFAPRMSQLAVLPTRQTPLLIGDATHQEVELQITLPSGAKVDGVTPAKVKQADRSVVVDDNVSGNLLKLKRVIDIPAGRVQPEDYASFVEFARRSDDAMNRTLRVRLGSK